MHIYDNILLSSSHNEKCFRQNLYRKSKHMFYVQQLSPENHAMYEIMRKNMVDPDRPQMTVKHGAWTLRAG